MPGKPLVAIMMMHLSSLIDDEVTCHIRLRWQTGMTELKHVVIERVVPLLK